MSHIFPGHEDSPGEVPAAAENQNPELCASCLILHLWREQGKQVNVPVKQIPLGIKG